MALLAFAIALTGVIPARAAPGAEVKPFEITPHRALYTMTLASAKSASNVVGGCDLPPHGVLVLDEHPGAKT